MGIAVACNPWKVLLLPRWNPTARYISQGILVWVCCTIRLLRVSVCRFSVSLSGRGSIFIFNGIESDRSEINKETKRLEKKQGALHSTQAEVGQEGAVEVGRRIEVQIL